MKLFRLIPLLEICFLISGCGKTEPTPTLDVGGTFTAVAQTMVVQYPSSTPTLTFHQIATPFSTGNPPVPTIFTTQVPQVNSAANSQRTSNTGCDNATFVADITIEDGTEIYPGETFEKTWQLYNAGTCTWDEDYLLVFISGSQMEGADTTLTESVSPGETVEITIELVAPTSENTYTGYWRMSNPDGTRFGDSIYVQIIVSSDSITATPTEEATEEEESTSTPEPTETPEPTVTPLTEEMNVNPETTATN